MGILAVALAVSLAACSDDPDNESSSGDGSDAPSATSDGPDAPLTEITVDCPEFEGVAQRIADAQTALYSGQGNADEAIEELQSELEGLKEGAPEDVQEALTDMGRAFGAAAEILRDQTPDQTELLELAPRLSEASQTITEFVTEQCG